VCAARCRAWGCGDLRLDGRIALVLLGEFLHLAADYIHPFESVSGTRSRCRIRVYLPDEEKDAPVFVCSELASNPGIPVTGAAEIIATEVITAHCLIDPVWIEYHTKETNVAGVESFELIIFSDYNTREVAGHTGSLGPRAGSLPGSLWIGVV
jgi:hypothetical protein